MGSMENNLWNVSLYTVLYSIFLFSVFTTLYGYEDTDRKHVEQRLNAIYFFKFLNVYIFIV